MLTSIVKTERRSQERKPVEIKTLEDAQQFVRAVGKRKTENDSRVKAWRLAKQATWLLLIVAAFLLYYLVDAVYQVVSLP